MGFKKFALLIKDNKAPALDGAPDTFLADLQYEYEAALLAAKLAKPEEYGFPASDVPAVVKRMLSSVVNAVTEGKRWDFLGSNPSLKRAVAKLGIKTSPAFRDRVRIALAQQINRASEIKE